MEDKMSNHALHKRLIDLKAELMTFEKKLEPVIIILAKIGAVLWLFRQVVVQIVHFVSPIFKLFG